MIRKKISDISYNLNYNCDLIHTELYSPSIVEAMYNTTFEVGDDDLQKAYHRNNDVTLLFNQQRLLKTLGVDTLNSWLEQLTPKSDALSELRSKCTDEQLLQICKSRYIQKPCELLAWSDYLNANAKELLAQIKSENASVSSEVDNFETVSSETSSHESGSSSTSES